MVLSHMVLTATIFSHTVMGKSSYLEPDSRIQSWSSCLIAMWCWSRYLDSLGLSYVICKMGIIIPSTSHKIGGVIIRTLPTMWQTLQVFVIVMRTFKVQSTDILVLSMEHEKTSVPKDQDEMLVFLLLSPTSIINPFPQIITCLRNWMLFSFLGYVLFILLI